MRDDGGPAAPSAPTADARGQRRRRIRDPESTRQGLLDAALRLFAAKGYHQVTVPDIVREAGVGHGTFYEYFSNRRDILLALTQRADEASQRRPRIAPSSLAERIRLEIVWRLTGYAENIELSRIWDEAAAFDAQVAADRRTARAETVARVRKGIEVASPPGVDPAVAASALVAMLEEFAHRWFVEGDGPGHGPSDVVSAAQTVANLWLRAIGVDGAADRTLP